jgi:RNA polymerase sigma-70 factor (ECF subfamily)
MMSAAETRSRNEQIDARLVAFLPRLRRFCHGLAGNADQGDDLLQAAFERALSRIDQWQVGTNLENWVFRLASNINIDRARARRVRGVPVDIEEAYDLAGEDHLDRLESRSELKAVRAALAALPVELRAVMATVVLEEKTYREAADILEIPIGTVMSRMSRARAFIEASVLRGPDTRASA